MIYASDPKLAYSDGDIVRLADGRFLTVLREHEIERDLLLPLV